MYYAIHWDEAAPTQPWMEGRQGDWVVSRFRTHAEREALVAEYADFDAEAVLAKGAQAMLFRRAKFWNEQQARHDPL
jgi:hypothetical protein